MRIGAIAGVASIERGSSWVLRRVRHWASKSCELCRVEWRTRDNSLTIVVSLDGGCQVKPSLLDRIRRECYSRNAFEMSSVRLEIQNFSRNP